MQAPMQLMGLCVALMVAVATATQRVSVSHTSLTIDEGFTQEITFRLDEPIICQTQDGECAVVIQVQNLHPEQVAIDNCIIKWTWRDWNQPRVLTISAVEDFIDDTYFEGVIVTDPVISRAEYYQDFNPEDITLKTRPRRTAQCRGTGDPHYTTFDGKYWHIYYAGRYVLYKATKRTFEVQVQTRAYPARHCAFAARENNDIVVVWACNGAPVVRRSCGSDECRKGGFPKLSVRGNSRRANYYVEFASGAMVRADTQPYYMNMYVTAPGQDYRATEGVCGNFDDNSGNDAPVYRAYSAGQLWDSQKPSYDLFSWYPEANPVTPAPKPGNAYEKCEYVEPTFIRPILNRPDAEDITNFIQDLDLTNIIENDDIIIGGQAVEEQDPNGMDQQLAIQTCDQFITDSKAAEVCLNNLPNFDLQPYIEDCADDLTETNNPDFIQDALEALERNCAERASRDLETWETDEDENPVEPNKEIQTNICLNACSNNGVCDEGICTCNDGFIGVDCSIDTTAAPVVTAVETPFCDVTGISGCSDSVTVLGSGFWNSDNLVCRFTRPSGETIETDGFFLGSLEVACAVPLFTFSGSDVVTATISISFDGQTFSSADDKTYTWYDGTCLVCDATGCGPNPNSCTIDGQCLRKGTANEDNICQECNPTASISDWTYTYQHHEDCGPAFPSGTPTVTVVGSADQGDVIYTVDATNENVAADPNNVITYTLTGGDGFFDVNSNGEVFMLRDLDVTTLGSNFDNFLQVVATDSAGNVASTGIVIDAVVQNIDPVFADDYEVQVPEDMEVGSSIVQVQAADRNGDAITYSWFSTEDGYADYFLIDETSGEVTLNRALDYEDRSQFTLVVRARDSGGQTHVTTLIVDVLNVDENPTDISIDNDSVEENSQAGTVVGTLSTVDPDDVDGTQEFDYSTTSTDFAIDGDKLVTAPGSSFDFEAGPTSYDVEITTTDASGLTFTKTITINVVDVNEKPHSVVLSIAGAAEGVYEIAESAPLDSIVGTVTVQDDDEDQVVLCSLAASDNHHFEMTGNNLVLIEHLDFEEDTEHMITVVCVDNGNPALASDPVDFSIVVTNVDDHPEDFALVDENLVVPENAQVGDIVARVVAFDYDAGADTFEFTVTKGKFAISGAPDCETVDGVVRCEVDLVLTEALDYETNSEEEVTIVAVSNGRAGSDRIVIPIANVNEPVSAVEWSDGANSIPEDAEAGTVVGTMFVVDPDNAQGVTYLFELITETETFEIRQLLPGQTGARRRRDASTEALAYAAQLLVKNPDNLDYENNSEMTITVRITDNSEPAVTSEVSTTVEITDAPLRLTSNPDLIHVAENSMPAAAVATLSLSGNDHAGIPYTIALVNDPTGSFELRGNEIFVVKNVDYETHQVVELTFSVDTQDIPLPTFVIPVSIDDENDAPSIAVDSAAVDVNSDTNVGQSIITVVANDQDGTPVEVTLGVAAASSPHEAALLEVFGYRANTKSVYVKKTPSATTLGNGVYHMTLTAASGSDTTPLDFTITVYDDCRNNQCAADETCEDRFKSYDCCVGQSCANSADPGFDGRFDTTTTIDPQVNVAGDDDDDSNNGGGNNGGTNLESKSDSAAASVPMIVGIVVGVLFLLAIVAIAFIIVSRRRNSPDALFLANDNHSKVFTNNPTYASASSQEPTYSQTDGHYQTVAFVPGVSNPLYEWYQPDMDRTECTEMLTNAAPGTFFVRDSRATPGWHVIGVRTESAVIHDKIKRCDDGTYELLPTSGARQPAFRDIPSLVAHYTEPRADVPFVLDASSMSNPMYDMSMGNNSTGQYAYAPGSVIPMDAAAPVVPIKDKERSAVAQVAAMDEGDIYTNTADAQVALNSQA